MVGGALAERSTHPSLGARLVDAGALNAVQLEHGSMRIGDTEHLGRLFERVPSVDRQTTLLMTELMNETCVAWLASQHVRGVVSIPYRHHPTGIHRWDRPSDAFDLSPGDPLPAPPPTEAPTEIAPPESVFPRFSNDTDPIIHWDEPSWLDERTTNSHRPGPDDTSTNAVDVAADEPIGSLTDDWVDRLEQSGLPTHGSDPLAPKTGLPPITVERSDRFEVIWPSGEIDDDFPPSRPVESADDRDRAGPTARVVREIDLEPGASADDSGLWDVDSNAPSFGPDDQLPVRADGDADRDRPEEVAATDDLAWERAHQILEGIESRLGGRSPKAPDNVASKRLLAPAEAGEVHDTCLWTRLAVATGAPGNSTALVGSPETVAAALARYYELGATSLLIRGYDPLPDAEQYGRELIPLVRAQVAALDARS